MQAGVEEDEVDECVVKDDGDGGRDELGEQTAHAGAAGRTGLQRRHGVRNGCEKTESDSLVDTHQRYASKKPVILWKRLDIPQIYNMVIQYITLYYIIWLLYIIICE